MKLEIPYIYIVWNPYGILGAFGTEEEAQDFIEKCCGSLENVKVRGTVLPWQFVPRKDAKPSEEVF